MRPRQVNDVGCTRILRSVSQFVKLNSLQADMALRLDCALPPSMLSDSTGLCYNTARQQPELRATPNHAGSNPARAAMDGSTDEKKEGAMLGTPKQVTRALDRVLHTVEKPARYTGGELNSIAKDLVRPADSKQDRSGFPRHIRTGRQQSGAYDSLRPDQPPHRSTGGARVLSVARPGSNHAPRRHPLIWIGNPASAA